MNISVHKRNRMAVVYALGAALLCGAARAEEPVGAELEEEESSPVSAEFALGFDSKYLSYGMVDNNDPILTPSAGLTFFDWFTLEVEAIFDTTRYGRKAGYTNRQFQYNELHPGAEIGHSFSSEDFEWLPTTVEFSFGYQYEYHPRSKGKHDPSWAYDTQFWFAEVSLPDLWIEPTFYFERDVMRDDGTYLNLEIGHTFALIDGEEEDDDPLLALRPSVAQGFGNRQRVAGYLFHEDGEPLRHDGLMDTFLKLELTWTPCDHFALSGYVGYSDFLFDRRIRDATRDYEATGRWDESYNFVGGLCATVSF